MHISEEAGPSEIIRSGATAVPTPRGPEARNVRIDDRWARQAVYSWSPETNWAGLASAFGCIADIADAA